MKEQKSEKIADLQIYKIFSIIIIENNKNNLIKERGVYYDKERKV